MGEVIPIRRLAKKDDHIIKVGRSRKIHEEKPTMNSQQAIADEYRYFDASNGLLRIDGLTMILQGFHPKPDEYALDHLCGQKVLDLNEFPYYINNRLLFEGWLPYTSVPFDRNYFTSKMHALEDVKDKNVIEERTRYRETKKPCIAFYVKD